MAPKVTSRAAGDPVPNTYNPTAATWNQVANKQAYDAVVYSNLNSGELPAVYDPIYNKLVEQISYTMYRRLQVLQKWSRIGRTAPTNQYPGILREIYMQQRKGQNFPMDNGTRPKQLNCYDIIDDTIDVRYHATQIRWMYGWTIFDEELRRFSGGNGEMIAQLAEMKMANCINARNLFCDMFRKKLLSVAAENVGIDYSTDIDISSPDLTPADAKKWLRKIDALCFAMSVGSAEFNRSGEYMQTPKAMLQMVIPYALYNNVVMTAFPDTYHDYYFQGLLPENLVLIDTMGNDALAATGSETTAIEPTFDEKGMNLLKWNATDGAPYLSINTDPTLQAVIMHRDVIGVEDNLNETLFGPKDIEKRATPVRSHYWSKGYVTDLLPCVSVRN